MNENARTAHLRLRFTEASYGPGVPWPKWLYLCAETRRWERVQINATSQGNPLLSERITWADLYAKLMQFIAGDFDLLSPMSFKLLSSTENHFLFRLQVRNDE
jgi:hypothetical protein